MDSPLHSSPPPSFGSPITTSQLTELDSLLGLTTTDNTQIRYDLHTNSLHVPSVGDLSAGPHSLNMLLSAISANQEGQSIQELSEIEVCHWWTGCCCCTFVVE